MNELEFIRHYVANAPQIMWFLGAGTSRSAGMPTATDIIWDLKAKYYCAVENQDLKAHDINSEAVKRKVQAFCDSKGYPNLWSDEEYSFYFDLTFNKDYAAQQKYLDGMLSPTKISLATGHKVLAALLALNRARLVFTTNFDEVIENAYALIANSNLPTFHLEGAYAALEALNQERFPIYTKLHGDFRYQTVKNLTADLKSNDVKLQDAFLSACARYGLIVTGYSGRDTNVMEMFNRVLSLPNPFPQGLFWTTPSKAQVMPAVTELINKAQAAGVNAHIIEIGTFDILMSKIWRQIDAKPQEIAVKIDVNNAAKLIPAQLPAHGSRFPILRTNILSIVEVPTECANISIQRSITYQELKDALRVNKASGVFTKTDRILAWGNDADFQKGLGSIPIIDTEIFRLENPTQMITDHTFYKAFYERALATALSTKRPLKLKSSKGHYYITVDPGSIDDPIFNNLKQTLKESNNPGKIAGRLSDSVSWSEAVEINLETSNGMLWLSLNPTIWIDPALERRNQIEFIKRKRLKRWNTLSFSLLDNWIEILFKSPAKGAIVDVSCFDDAKYPVKFKINTRTAYSKL